jgi:hypothetical protein
MKRDVTKSFISIIAFLVILTVFIYKPLGKELFDIIFKKIAIENTYVLALCGLIFIPCVYFMLLPLISKYKYVKVIVTYLLLLLFIYMLHLLSFTIFVRVG